MSVTPLDLEGRFKQRWAARFSRPEQAAALQKHRLKGLSKTLAALLKAKRKTRRVEPAGLRSLPTV
jgi:hypothetical protein